MYTVYINIFFSFQSGPSCEKISKIVEKSLAQDSSEAVQVCIVTVFSYLCDLCTLRVHVYMAYCT